MSDFNTVVVGGGAAGICAAISAARLGNKVVICEKTAYLGKKILATGNGRCNLANNDLDETFYNTAAQPLVKSIYKQFGKLEILGFFKELGLETVSKDGRIFPATNQAASVLKVLEMELKRLDVPVEFNFECNVIDFAGSKIVVNSKSGKKLKCNAVVVTGGGKSYPALGSDGSVYGIVKAMGHVIVEPVPSAVPLVVKDPLCTLLQGQRINAAARSVINGQTGLEVPGELLFTKYGLSGTCGIDVSEDISIALNRAIHNPDVMLEIDLIPFMSPNSLKAELEKRKQRNIPTEEMLVGLLPNKFATALKSLFVKGDLNAAVSQLKARRFRVSGTRGWNEAEFTSGGINVSGVNPVTLESKLKKGVYFAGEILDVNGKRGGYNLAWAWASGYVAGRTK